MEKLRCLIVEDEPLSQDILLKYIGETPSLELVATCGDAVQASSLLRKTAVDLIFLDINLPGISGMTFLRALSHPPMVIFTTAYPEFAVQGFETDAVDYLLKPFPFERFLKAVNKAFERAEVAMGKKNGKELTEGKDAITLRADKKMHRIRLADIHYLEATGDYIKVVLTDRSLIIHATFKHILEELPSAGFLRVHRSFIVPVNRIRFLDGNQLNVDGKMIPVGQVFREGLLEFLKENKE